MTFAVNLKKEKLIPGIESNFDFGHHRHHCVVVVSKKNIESERKFPEPDAIARHIKTNGTPFCP